MWYVKAMYDMWNSESEVYVWYVGCESDVWDENDALYVGCENDVLYVECESHMYVRGVKMMCCVKNGVWCVKMTCGMPE